MLLPQQLAGLCGNLKMTYVFRSLGGRLWRYSLHKVAAMAQSWTILCKIEYQPILKEKVTEIQGRASMVMWPWS